MIQKCIVILSLSLVIYKDFYAQSRREGIVKSNKSVLITANLKGTDFTTVPIHSLVKDYLERMPVNFDHFSYDSITGDFKGSFTLNKPGVMLFFLKQVYVTPGDSVNLKYVVLNNTQQVYKDTLIVTGTHSGNYLYYTFVRGEYRYPTSSYPKYTLPFNKYSFGLYNRQINEFYKRLKAKAISTFKPGTFTRSYEQFILNEINIYRLYDLVRLLQNQEKDWLPSYKRNQFKREILESIDTNSYFFYYTLLTLHRALSTNRDLEYTSKEFKRLEIDALSYTLKLRDYLISSDIIDFATNAKNIDANLTAVMSSSSKKIITDRAKNVIAQYDFDEEKAIQKLSNGLGTLKVIDDRGNQNTLANLFNNNSAEITYVDFWASWCRPCRYETKFTKSIEDDFRKNNIRFLQISIDKNKEDWKKAIKEDNILFSENYCLVNEDDYLRLCRELRLNFVGGVPHYLVLDKQGNIVIKNAPRPSEGNIIEFIKRSGSLK